MLSFRKSHNCFGRSPAGGSAGGAGLVLTVTNGSVPFSEFAQVSTEEGMEQLHKTQTHSLINTPILASGMSSWSLVIQQNPSTLSTEKQSTKINTLGEYIKFQYFC